MKEGLVAPVWSDSGEAPVVDVACIRLDFDPSTPAYVAWKYEPFTGQWHGGVILKETSTANLMPSDPNAKPALPALTRVGGNKRGPGWCDE